jgi:hypothetical protein
MTGRFFYLFLRRKRMTHGESYTFENGPNCKGSGATFGEGATSYSADIIHLRDTYPDRTEWSYNTETAFDVMVVKGGVTIAIRRALADVEHVQLHGSSENHAYHIPAKTLYRYEHAGVDTEDGWTEISLMGTPAFTKEQYQVIGEEELVDEEGLLSVTDPMEFEVRRSAN